MFITTQTVSLSTLLGIVLVPVSMLVAAQGWIWTFFVFCFLSLTLCLSSKWYLSKSKKRPQFFVVWTVTSLFFLLGVFEFEVVPFLEILFYENFLLVCWFALACLFAHLTRHHSIPASSLELKYDNLQGESYNIEWSRCELCSLMQSPRCSHCKLCGFCISRRFYHCLWLDVCIGSENHRFFLGCLVSLFIACCYYANLTLTTVCHPTLIGGLFLFPDDCSDVFGEIHISICFVSALYALLIAVAVLFNCFQQCWLLYQNNLYPDFRSKGLFLSCVDFLCHC